MLNLQTVTVPIITPKHNSDVDSVGLERVIDFLVGSGIDSLFVLGTNGEFQYLLLEQKKEVIDYHTSHKRSQILVGVSDYKMSNTLELLRFCGKRDVDGIVVTPMLNMHKDEPLYVLESVTKRSSLPIVIYNNPNIHYGENLPLPFVKPASKDGKIAGMKDSSGDQDYFQKLLDYASEDFRVLQGSEKTIVDSLNKGASGIISGSANVDPKLFRAVYEDKSPELQEKVLALKKEISSISPNYINGMKQRLVKMGLIESAEMWMDTK